MDAGAQYSPDLPEWDERVSPDDLSLCPPDGDTPAEILHRGTKVYLPLPATDKAAIEAQIRKKQRLRYTLPELMGVMTFVGLILGASTWLPLGLVAAVLGIVSVFLTFAAVRGMLSSRTGTLVLASMLIGYLCVAVVAAGRVLFS